MTDTWRGVVAALTNSDLRAVLADHMTAPLPLSPRRRARAVRRLADIGLLRREGEDDGWVFDDAPLRELLATRPRPAGPERFLGGDGRIDRYPARPDDRAELLRWIAQRAFPVDEVLTEPQVNERLLPFTEDVAVLRRHLVDHELLERTRSGSEYARVAPDGSGHPD